MLGLAENVFKPAANKSWGTTPSRVARKVANVARENLKAVLAISGKMQVSVRLELLEEERKLGLATHTIEGTDSEVILARLGDVPHLGVIHLRFRKCLVRCEREHLSQMRARLCPQDPRFALAPETQILKHFVVQKVPKHVSPLCLSAALVANMGWKQIAIEVVRGNTKKAVHSIKVGDETSPKSDTIIIEGHACIIKELGGSRMMPECHPKVLPPTSVPMEIDQPSSTCAVVEQKIASEVQAAKEALQSATTSTISASSTNVETRVLGQVEQKFADLSRRLSAVENINGRVEELAQGVLSTQSAIQNIQHSVSSIEPLIEKKVSEATAATAQALNSSLETRFDELGDRLMKSIAQMAKKRDGDHAEGESNFREEPVEVAESKRKKVWYAGQRTKRPMKTRSKQWQAQIWMKKTFSKAKLQFA